MAKEAKVKEDVAATKTKKVRKSKTEQFRMTDLIAVVQEVTSLSRRESKVAIQAVIYAVKKGMLDKGFVKIPGFGKFVKIHKKAVTRKSFGKMTDVPEKDVVKFRPLKSFKQLVNGKIQLEQYVEDAPESTEEKK
jgi:DNA-binding protein HU-beta